MPSTDPLDAADFNPTAHINRLFPNEESLAEVDAHVGGLQERMRELDEEVLRTVRQQTSAGSSARKDLENAKASVAELFLKVLGVGLAVGVGVGAGAGAGALLAAASRASTACASRSSRSCSRGGSG